MNNITLLFKRMILVSLFGMVMYFGIPASSSLADIKGSFTIKPSPTTWTNQSVILNVTATGVDKILLPDSTIVQGTKVTYTASSNGAYSFIGYNAENEVQAIETYIVDKIDRTPKEATVMPNDGKWKNQDVEVQIQVKN